MIREAWTSRELLFFLAWRDVKIRYKQTLLGASWAVLQPLLGTIIFSAVFAGVAGMETGGVPAPLFYAAALVPWTFFAGALTNSGNSLITNTDLLTKVYFPRALLPSSTLLAGLVDLTIATLLLGVLYAYYGVAPDVELFAWPVAVAALVMLALGAGLLVSAVNVMYRDVKYALPFAVQLLLFVSPIIYQREEATHWALDAILAINPLTGILEACRAAAVPGISIEWGQLGISVALSAALLLVGAAYFRRVERRFADVV